MDSPSITSARSTTDDLPTAAREASANLLRALGGRSPDLVFAFASAQWPSGQEALPGLGRLLREQTGCETLIGCTAGAIVEGDSEVEEGPALSLLAVRAAGAEIRPLRLTAHREYGGGVRFEGLEPGSPTDRGLVLLGDPYSFPMPALLDQLGEQDGLPPITGGMASGGSNAGEHLLWSDDEDHVEGAVGVAFGGPLHLETCVSQGCRPVGEPLVITASQGNLIVKLRGKPAAKVMVEMLNELEPADRSLFQRGAFVGLALDATKSTFEPSDFLVRNVMGFAPQQQAIAVASPEIRTGMTVQFLVRDGDSASDELTRILRQPGPDWSGATTPGESGALLFTCGGRGQRMFGRPHHDATAIQDALGPKLPLAGFFAGGEVGRVGQRSFLHGFTASIALLRVDSLG